MPFYDLKCDKCGNEFNKMASMSDRENNKIVCPECGSNSLSTVFKNINIIQSRKSKNNECPHASTCGGCCGH